MLKKNFSTPYGSLLFMVEVQTDKSMNGLGFDLRIVWSFDRPRNPANQANETELAYINMLKIKEEKQEVLPPSILIVDGKMTGYYPIQTARMCIQCHGTLGTDILPETAERLHLLYPQDKATGYGENQLRGLFVVEMN